MATASKPMVNISLAKIEESITTCESIVSSLEGTEGAVPFREAHKEIETNLDDTITTEGNLNAKDRYDGEGSSIKALEDFLNQYVDLTQNERDLLHKMINEYISEQEAKIFSDFFNGTGSLKDDWVKYGQLKGLANLLDNIDPQLDNAINNGMVLDGSIDVVIKDNVIIVRDKITGLVLGRYTIEIPPLTPGELEMKDIYDEYKDTTFTEDVAMTIISASAGMLTGGAATAAGATLSAISLISAGGDFVGKHKDATERFMSNFGLTLNKNNEVQYSLYSLLMINELAEQYEPNSNSGISESVDIVLDESKEDVDRVNALKDLGDWAENEQADINERLGLTNEK